MYVRACVVCSEENVWKLCEQVRKTRPTELAKCYAVFVSNEGRTVPLWRQKAGRGDDKVVIWVSISSKWLQFSFNNHLGFHEFFVVDFSWYCGWYCSGCVAKIYEMGARNSYRDPMRRSRKFHTKLQNHEYRSYFNLKIEQRPYFS